MSSHTFLNPLATLANLPADAESSSSSSSSNQDLSNCFQTDKRLPQDWSCSSNRACISVDNAGAVICCPAAYGCAKMDQQPCGRSDPFWKDRVRTYDDKDPRISCPNSGLCCPTGYQCIDAVPKEAGYCVLSRSSAIYPKGLDPDYWENCENDCNRYDVCCPDMCQGNQCTKTATATVRWISISPAQATMDGGSAQQSSSSSSFSSSSSSSLEPSTTKSSSNAQSPLTGPDSSWSTGMLTPSSTPSQPPETSNSNPSQGNVIAGAIVGGLTFLCALLGLFYCLRKRQRNKKAIPSRTRDAQDSDGDHQTPTPGHVPQVMGSPHMSLASPVPTATSNTLVEPSDSCQRSRAPAGVIYPFIREESSEPISLVTPAAASTLGSDAGRGGALSTHDESVEDEHEHEREDGLMSVGEGGIRRQDPNGSEVYEMQRWGKSH